MLAIRHLFELQSVQYFATTFLMELINQRHLGLSYFVSSISCENNVNPEYTHIVVHQKMPNKAIKDRIGFKQNNLECQICLEADYRLQIHYSP